MARHVKDLALLLRQLGSLLWCVFDLWPGNFHTPQVQLKQKIFNQKKKRNFHCGATGSAVSLEHWNAGSIPSLAQCVKDLALSELLCRLQLWLGSGVTVALV